MKHIWKVSVVTVLIGSTAIASESGHLSTQPKIAYAMGRACAEIVTPVSASVPQDIKLDIDSSELQNAISIGGYKKASSYGEIQLSGPKNQLVSVNIANTNVKTHLNSAEFHPRLINSGNVLALDDKNGTKKIQIGGTLKLKGQTPQTGVAHGEYVFQVSY